MTSVLMNSKRLPMERTWVRLLIIAIVFAVVGALSIWVVTTFDLVSSRLAWLALVACVISSLVAHLLGEYPSGEEKFMARLGGGMVARTSLPFLFVIYVQMTTSEPLGSAFVIWT